MGTNKQLSIKQIICYNIKQPKKLPGMCVKVLPSSWRKRLYTIAVILMPMKSHTLANNAKLRFKIYPN